MTHRAPPLQGSWPTSQWGQGQIARDPYRLFLPGDLEPGRYTLRLGIYDTASGRELLRKPLVRVRLE